MKKLKRLSLVKFFLISVLIFSSLGFHLLTHARWNISTAEPTIWVKFCDTNWSFTKFDFPQGDPLWGTEPTVPKAIESVFNDINAISSSFLRLASYPTDPSNPPAPQAGDSIFTRPKGDERTIHVCFLKGGRTTGGHARPVVSNNGKQLRSCEIIIQDSNRFHSGAFVNTLGHEIGHCLGLDHAKETLHSIMSYSSNTNNFIRYRIDDKMALTYLYGRPRDGESLKENFTYGLSCDFK